MPATKKPPLGLAPAQETKMISATLPFGLYTRLKTTAFSQGKTANELVVKALSEFLKSK
jgi:hypothetical protein